MVDYPKLVSTQGSVVLGEEGKLWVVNSSLSSDNKIILELVPYQPEADLPENLPENLMKKLDKTINE